MTFKVNVARIDMAGDGDPNFGRHADFSATTIEMLIKTGETDADNLLEMRRTQYNNGPQ